MVGEFGLSLRCKENLMPGLDVEQKQMRWPWAHNRSIEFLMFTYLVSWLAAILPSFLVCILSNAVESLCHKSIFAWFFETNYYVCIKVFQNIKDSNYSANKVFYML